MGEFELIQRFFQRHAAEQHPESLVLGVGDDAALLGVSSQSQLAVTVDTLVSGVHFPADAPPDDIAQRALRVNLSDLAAMGAEPQWFTLALTLPSEDDDWLRAFSRGLFEAADEFNCFLVGGDTTRGPLSVTVQVIGTVPPGEALRRDGAGVGDFVLVTHTLGDGAAGLALVQQEGSADAETNRYLRQRYFRPEPRLKEGAVLRGLASAALDLSDGLVADLGHICAASGLAARIDVEHLPLSPAVTSLASLEEARRWALSGGDDYELCFTVPERDMAEVGMLIAGGDLQASVIGKMEPGRGVRCELNGEAYPLASSGYTHF